VCGWGGSVVMHGQIGFGEGWVYSTLLGQVFRVPEGVPCPHFCFPLSFLPFDLPSSKFQGSWTTSKAFDSHLVFNGDWHHIALAVEDTKSDALL